MNGLDVWSAMILGAVQGATEFLPVSSDGHLAIAAFMLDRFELSLATVVVLHVGTLLATLIVLRKPIGELLADLFKGFARPREYLRSESGKLTIAIVVASIPTAIVGLALEDRVEGWSHVRWIVGVCLLGSAAAVFSTRFFARGETVAPTWPRALVIGAAQGLAVLPGLSRSASTIAIAMALGMSGPAAFRFSFLLSIPAVAGATVLELAKPGALAGVGGPAIVGGLVAFAVGLGALVLLRETIARGRLWTFALYLVPLGVGMIAWQLWIA